MTPGRWLLLIGAVVVAFLALRSWLAPANPYVTQVTMRGHDNTQQPRKWKAYACTKQVAPVYVKLGGHVRKFGSDFSLTNQPDPDKIFVQDAAVLNVRLSSSTAVEAIIVLAKAPFNGADTHYSGHENDKLAPVQHVSPGKSLHYTLHTDQYVREQANGDIINAVTLCLTRPHNTAIGNSAQWAPMGGVRAAVAGTGRPHERSRMPPWS